MTEVTKGEGLIQIRPYTTTCFTVKDVSPVAFIQEYSQHLRETSKLTEPSWLKWAKTGAGKDFGPENEDFFFVRAASLVLRLYKRPGLGVSSTRKIYSWKKRNDTRRNHVALGSGKINRVIFQQLEKAGLVEIKADVGRVLSPAGMSEVDLVAREIFVPSV